MSCITVHLTPAFGGSVSRAIRIGTVISASLTEIPSAVLANLQPMTEPLAAAITAIGSDVNISVTRDADEIAISATSIKASLVVAAKRICTVPVRARAFSKAFSKDFS